MEIVDSYNLPYYIKESKLYKQLKQDDEDEYEAFSIPIKYAIDFINFKLNTMNDLDKLLNSLRYWMVERLPDSVYSFINNNFKLDFDDLLEKYYDFQLCEEIKYFVNLLKDYMIDRNIIPMNEIVKTKYMNLLRWAFYSGEDRYKWGEISLLNAIIAQNYDVIVFVLNHDAHFDFECVWTALGTNDFKIAKYVYNAWLKHPAYQKNKWLTVIATTKEIKELVKGEF